MIILAVYPIINTKTGEQKEVSMSVHEWDQWKNENEDWIRDWSDPSTAPNACEVGEWRDKLDTKHPGWKEIVKKAAKSGGSKSKI